MSIATEADLVTPLSNEILDHCKDQFVSHGIDLEQVNLNHMRFSYLDCTMDLHRTYNGLRIRLETPSDNLLSALRDELVERVEAVDSNLAESLRWTGHIDVGARPNNFRVLRAVARRKLFPGMLRVTLAGTDVNSLQQDGIHVRLMMPLQRGRQPVWPTLGANGRTVWPKGDDKLHSRFVTIRALRLKEREVDVDIASHRGGLVSDWASMEGDDKLIGVIGPGGDAELTHKQDILLAGDATGLPAIARLIESVSGSATGVVFGAAPDVQQLRDYLPPTSLDLVAINSEDFDSQVAAYAKEYGKKSLVSYAWFAGESSAARQMRTVFKDSFGLDKEHQMSVAYWRHGDPGHASREL